MAPHRRHSPLARLVLVTAGLLSAALLACAPTPSPVDDARHPDPPRPPLVVPTAPGPTPPPLDGGPPAGADEQRGAFGAFLDSEPEGLALLKRFSGWLDGTELRVGHTYLPGDVWSNIEGGNGFLDSWAQWRQAEKDRMFVLNVPLMEHNEAEFSDTAVRRLLRHAAAGAFDEHFRVLAQRLVDLGATDTVLVLGWEMNGTTYTHRCAPDPEDWKEYWRRIVTVMRSVPGQKFKFDFAPNRGADAIPWPECYPGDDVVDIVGMDSYDQPHGMSFDEEVSEPYGLQFHVDFAQAHGKPISYPEWGLFRNGDNPTYMLRMLAWIEEHKPLYNTITDYCPHGVWQCATNPRSSALYREVLSSASVPLPTPSVPVPMPVPAAPTPPAVPLPTPVPPPVPLPPRQPATPATPAQPPGCTPAAVANGAAQPADGRRAGCAH
ncbi:glycoside hydrolase family 26 protein [Streptomyces sp. NBC_00847]|uniref:glycoside hydrolase family 26 protein n=1 Tax=Streptomyces sp. NBC_00847 TaxID=2975850 RepID=UPI00224CAC43|nr:glycosyl hydrolase [Streptomyces sp. NBC_00847]MCX4880914.1 glycosyl hydrolase [Streptomyces sp. NBC_00847]